METNKAIPSQKMAKTEEKSLRGNILTRRPRAMNPENGSTTAKESSSKMNRLNTSNISTKTKWSIMKNSKRLGPKTRWIWKSFKSSFPSDKGVPRVVSMTQGLRAKLYFWYRLRHLDFKGQILPKSLSMTFLYKCLKKATMKIEASTS